MKINQIQRNYQDNYEPPPLPLYAITKSGVKFYPSQDNWSYRDSSVEVNLKFQTISCVTPIFIQSLKSVLIWYAENRSAEFLINIFYRLRHLCRTIAKGDTEKISTITGKDLLNYYSSLEIKNKWYLSGVAGLIKKWCEFGLPGISPDAKILLDQLKLKGNQKGDAVRTLDTEFGAFTDIELQAICAALNNAYANKTLQLDGFLLAWLFMLLGARPAQLAAMKVCDASEVKSKDGTVCYTLKVPRAKQRDGIARNELKNRLIIPQIGKLLLQHASITKTIFSKILTDPENAPMFPNSDLNMTQSPKGFEFHQVAKAIGYELKKILDVLGVSSERTGGPMHINARRFRYTIGTRAAAEGHGSLIIAELLDHTDTQNVGVYVQSSPGMIERIDRAMAMYMAPMAQAFAGTLIIDEAEAIRGNDPRSRIVDPVFDTSFKPIGNCGSFNFCGFAAPIACYTCRNFQPWLDGPHEAVLAHLLSERERLKSSADMRIASINDRTIFAVAQVITQCEQVRAEMAEGGDLG